MKNDKFIIAREYVVSLFPIFQLADSFGDSIKKIIGTSIGEFAGRLEGHSIWWIAREKGWFLGHQAVVSRIKNNPQWFNNILQQIEQQGGALGRLSKNLAKGRLDKISNRELANRYLNFSQKNTHLYDLGLVCSLLDYQNNTYLSDSVNGILSKKLLIKNISEVFTLLTTSSRLWPDKEQELKLVGIYKKIITRKILKELLLAKSSSDFLLDLWKIDKDIYHLLVKHGDRYAYLTYVYEGPAVGLDFYIDIMKNWLLNKLKPVDLKKKQTKDKNKLIKEQKKLLSKLKLSAEELVLIKFAQKVSFVKPYRRLLQSQAYYYFEPVLAEVARRLNLTLRQVRYLLPQEVQKGLLVGRVSVDLVNTRIKSCVYINFNGQKRLLIGRSAINFWKTVKKEQEFINLKKIKGSTAYPGKISGRVVLVNMPADMVNMKLGDILVSSATSPNLMPAIRKAGAIVTDEGGITCHAAIVSRELKIPCLIGTKIATKVLKTGDKVLVNATAGVVYKK
ncbi:hypothetical protein KKC17_03145 [Patescibacteria group bacterium]|nr:hypothetical protein [Patescibacteria group bacterium]